MVARRGNKYTSFPLVHDKLLAAESHQSLKILAQPSGGGSWSDHASLISTLLVPPHETDPRKMWRNKLGNSTHSQAYLWRTKLHALERNHPSRG